MLAVALAVAGSPSAEAQPTGPRGGDPSRAAVSPPAGNPAGSPAFRIVPFTPAAQKQFTPAQIATLEKLNRRDREHLSRLGEVIAPEVWLDDELRYSPMPMTWAWAEPIAKVIVVHQPSQVFGAYEFGKLVKWGPVSTGREESATPSGVFNLTWRAKSRRSTDNQAWLLNWYFNFINERGISFHEFELPGRAASHACVRLLTRDAIWVYGWGQEWVLSANKRRVTTPGTPVVILGVVDFAAPPPWLSLEWWKTKIVLPDDPPL